LQKGPLAFLLSLLLHLSSIALTGGLLLLTCEECCRKLGQLLKRPLQPGTAGPLLTNPRPEFRHFSF